MEIPNKLVSQIIERGRILHSDMFKHIDHGKFFVIIGVTDTEVAGFFYINSRINKAIEAKQEQLDLQYLIRPVDYPFLHHDSFISAVEITKIDKEKLVETIINGDTQTVSQLKQVHLNEILDMVRGSKLYSKKDKENFFY